jgi:RNA polymerase sigma factor (sigma-70 family)
MTETREERFTRLFEEQFEPVRRYVWRRDPAHCEDVVSETFLVAWRRLDDVPADARPWLIGVARNVRLNVHRSARRQDSVSQRLSESSAPGEQHEPELVSDAVKQALHSLAEPDREVLLLSVWDELDRSQIARVLGTSKSNVSVRLHRARRRFADALEQESPHPFLIPGGASDVC